VATVPGVYVVYQPRKPLAAAAVTRAARTERWAADRVARVRAKTRAAHLAELRRFVRACIEGGSHHEVRILGQDSDTAPLEHLCHYARLAVCVR